MLFQDKEIEILVYDVDETAYLSQSDENRQRLLTAIANIERGGNRVEVSLEDLT
jgi:antitoxin YefM